MGGTNGSVEAGVGVVVGAIGFCCCCGRPNKVRNSLMTKIILFVNKIRNISSVRKFPYSSSLLGRQEDRQMGQVKSESNHCRKQCLKISSFIKLSQSISTILSWISYWWRMCPHGNCLATIKGSLQTTQIGYMSSNSRE